MKSEQLFQIDRQINQIRKQVEQRQQKVAEWNIPLSRILQPRLSPEQYLSKKYSASHLSHYQKLSQGAQILPRALLERHVADSRVKVRAHRNQLKELDELVRKRNVIRVLRGREAGEEAEGERRKREKSAPKKEASRTTHDVERGPKLDREHSAFSGLRGERITEIVQEGKARGATGEEVALAVKRQLGIGLESTPFYEWMERQGREEVAERGKPVREWRSKENAKFNFFATMQQEIRPRKDIYLGKTAQLGEKFQQRLMRILKFNQQRALEIVR